MTTLSYKNKTVKIDQGELISYLVEGHEYIHQKGSPGWRSADTEMFPIIGPTADANFRVKTAKGEAVQDQHGLLREMDYELESADETKAVFEKKYIAGTQVNNSKFPAKSTEEILAWPYDFTFKKSFNLSGNGLVISFSISGEQNMPFMLGYHPAFNLVTKAPIIKAKGKEITLAEVLAVGNRAYQVKNCTEIVLKDKKELKITSEGFGSFMLWTEVENMICIEPITFYPYEVKQENLAEGFMYLEDREEQFTLTIAVV
ncbi:aldose 1-epimerase [Cellulophaga baltica]|uniref:aldose epimerase family protein n=1 Tax=Cellulophaga TaxID=104264 RepID=UPI001C068D1D|nr:MULTISPECIES: aldose 1-epimerase [Cellulophaga]MBU2997010.1 aldose 1-epimerase [Cellulophaga baltica]MDO6768408.1 aldose 1-epimerase [Cellulophaga sp. 1_MG-2023]